MEKNLNRGKPPSVRSISGAESRHKPNDNPLREFLRTNQVGHGVKPEPSPFIEPNKKTPYENNRYNR